MKVPASPGPESVVITANRRLARQLRHEYDGTQLGAGRRSWAAPDIVPLEAWLERSWRDWIYAGPAGPAPRGEAPRLLRPVQEHVVWERIIAGDSQGLTAQRAMAATALDAWNLACAWHVPLEAPDWADTDDSQMFQSWARAFEARCRSHGWLPRGWVADRVADLLDDGSLPPPSSVTLVGFNEHTPAELRLIASMRQAGCRIEEDPVEASQDPPPAVSFRVLDRRGEIRAAAEWCRDLIERSPVDDGRAPIGVVVPDLALYRAEIESVFTEILHPSRTREPSRDADRAFNISLGPSLADYPLIQSAIDVLRLDPFSMPVEDAGRMIRSPFVGSMAELTRRSLLDRAVRRLREPEVTVDALLDRAPRPDLRCPDFYRRLRLWRDASAALGRDQAPSKWAQAVTEVLKSIGWPGDRPASSAEFQTLRAWDGVLSELAGLDGVLGSCDLGTVIGLLERMTGEYSFQPESGHAPIQILGLLEASGLEFSHLWVMGMHDGAWPRSSLPNPFLPLRLQRRLRLPQSSPDRDLEFAELLTRRLFASAPRIVVSHPEKDGDEELRPSPLVGELPSATADDVPAIRTPSRFERLRESGRLEVVDDFQAPPFQGTLARGGTSVLKHQAACGFRAFAMARLGASDSPQVGPGLDPSDRGNLVHRILERVWARLGSHSGLVSMPSGDLNALVSGVVEEVVDEFSRRRKALTRPRFRAIERLRLEELVSQWLDIERSRRSFSVLAREERRRVEIGGLDLEIRADRVDRLEDGTLVVIDYKTADHKPSEWEGPRPDEPQLPLYAATADAGVSGVFFGILKAGKTGFRGFAASEGIVAGLSGDDADRGFDAADASLDRAIGGWRQVLEDLGVAFREGAARVDPKDPSRTCRYCPLGALCRIHEIREPDLTSEPANGCADD